VYLEDSLYSMGGGRLIRKRNVRRTRLTSFAQVRSEGGKSRWNLRGYSPRSEQAHSLSKTLELCTKQKEGANRRKTKVCGGQKGFHPQHELKHQLRGLPAGGCIKGGEKGTVFHVVMKIASFIRGKGPSLARTRAPGVKSFFPAFGEEGRKRCFGGKRSA